MIGSDFAPEGRRHAAVPRTGEFTRDFEIDLRDFGAAGERTTQVTNLVAGSAGEPGISSGGNRVVFSSTANIGDNADGNREIYLATCTPRPRRASAKATW